MLHSYVIDLRVKRAQKTATRVLGQTSLDDENRNRYALAIARNCVEKGLSPAVVAAIVVVESRGNSLAVAPSGDLGLMQVNVRIHSRVFNFEERNLLNPEQNIAVGTSILKGMVVRHGNENAIIRLGFKRFLAKRALILRWNASNRNPPGVKHFRIGSRC
jgi:soluble lytic murein transglycosylase-like protein